MRTRVHAQPVAGFTLIFALLVAAPVSAQSAFSAAPQPSAASADVEAVIASPEYKELIREGMLKYTRGLWPEALGYFSKAHELAPNARTLRGLAMVSYDSHHYVEAIDYAERALAHPVQPLNEKMAEELTRLRQQAEALVARVKLVTKPVRIELSVDGKPTPVRADGRVWIDAGAHDLSLSAPGFTTQTRHLQLAESSQTNLEVELSAQAAQAPSRVASVQSPRPQAATSSPLSWILVGVSAGLAAVGGALLATDRSSSGTMPAGIVLLGVGGVGLAAGLTWSFWPSPEPEHAAAAQFRLGLTSASICGSF